jgi:hypothetical protein
MKPAVIQLVVLNEYSVRAAETVCVLTALLKEMSAKSNSLTAGRL